MRRLRSLLDEIHPPNLRASGLEAALEDAASPLRTHGVEVTLELDPHVELGDEDERLAYRVAAEALRNVERHARATRVAVTLQRTAAGVELAVADDGTGFTPEERRRRAEDGHVGLSLLEELAAGSGGALAIRSAPGGGTTVALELPVR
jgi:signal transduction histidine kinase